MDQEVKEIRIDELVLWTENPRDPIDETAKDQDIVDRALDDRYSKWTLRKLAKKMGDYYDFSELPAVVYINKKPVVYDGNRRIILGKIKHGLVSVSDDEQVDLPEFPEKIPCNVCEQKIALQNVFRKHADSGSWSPLERDIFLHKFMGKDKSTFLILDEKTKLISANSYMNKGFIKDEIFKDENLKRLGFSIQDGQLLSSHSNDESSKVLRDLENKIREEKISTRKNRGKVIEVLEPSTQQLIDTNKNKSHKPVFMEPSDEEEKPSKVKKTRRRRSKKGALFGGSLYLISGEVADLYRDIEDLYLFYHAEKSKLSDSFLSLIRMSLRLLVETAAKDKSLRLDKFVQKHFDKAKAALGKDLKTTLSTQNVTKENFIQLLHVGAHNYQASKNIEQTYAISLIIGTILTITHGKDGVE